MAFAERSWTFRNTKEKYICAEQAGMYHPSVSPFQCVIERWRKRKTAGGGAPYSDPSSPNLID